MSYVKAGVLRICDKTIYRIEKAAATFWNITNGTINKENMDALSRFVLKKYNSEDSKGKMLAFAKDFLKYLTRIKLDTRYYTFEVFLELPKALKNPKNITSRIMTREDIENILRYVKKSQIDGKISRLTALQYTAFVVFGAYTGQRSLATISRLTVGQFRDALKLEKPALCVRSSQDKIRMEHYVPLHPRVISAFSDSPQTIINYRDFALLFKGLVAYTHLLFLTAYESKDCG